jgi:hypothetical protein
MDENFFNGVASRFEVVISLSPTARYIIPNCRFVKGEIRYIGNVAIGPMEEAGLSIGDEVFYDRYTAKRAVSTDYEQAFDIVKYDVIIDLVGCRTHLKELEGRFKYNNSKWLKLYTFLEYVLTLNRGQLSKLSELCLFEEHMQNALGDAPDQEVVNIDG